MRAHRLRTTLAAALLAGLATGAVAQDAASFSGQEGPDQWRASRLIGVPLTGPGNKTVGKIVDILMTHDGKAQAAVVGVGGFLGIGQKDVAIPFDQIRFVDEPLAPPANPVAPAAPGDAGMMGNAAPGAPATTTTAAGGVPTSAALGTTADTLGTPTAPAMAGATGEAPAPADARPRSTAYPDHGVIDLTADQLKAAPSFRFAP